MTTVEACQFVMPFGKYRGKTLREIAIDYPDGARLLDRVVGFDGRYPDTEDALKTFLAIPWVAKLVDEAVSGKEYGEPEENRYEPPPWWET